MPNCQKCLCQNSLNRRILKGIESLIYNETNDLIVKKNPKRNWKIPYMAFFIMITWLMKNPKRNWKSNVSLSILSFNSLWRILKGIESRFPVFFYQYHRVGRILKGIERLHVWMLIYQHLHYRRILKGIERMHSIAVQMYMFVRRILKGIESSVTLRL